MTCVLTGDASLRRRPVARIIEPLRSMGAVLHGRHHDSLPPLTVVGHTPLRAVDVTTPVPSAQVKSAILLAGLRAEGRTTVRERVATRDHTERMLRARGVPVERVQTAGRWRRRSRSNGGVAVQAIDERVPGDVSAAAFWLVAGAIHPDAELTLRDVGVNPTRRAVIDLLRAMGADIDETPDRERRIPTTASASRWPTSSSARPALHAIDLGPAEVAAAIDEIPVLCLAAARARGHDDDPRRRASCATRNPTGSPASPPGCARWARASRSTATTCASMARRAAAARRRDRQPRRPPPGDDLRHRRARRRRPHDHRAGPAPPPSPTRPSSTTSNEVRA